MGEVEMILFLLTCFWGPASGVSEVRLVNGSSRCSGRVEVFRSGQWGTVCDDNWDIQDARVVCRQLGCKTAVEVVHSAHFGRGTGRIWLDDLECKGTESSFDQCGGRPWGKHNCNHGEDAGVICAAEIRLMGGPTACSGRLEVFHNQQWGTVCDHGWDMHEARVVCQEVGCGEAKAAPGRAKFGKGSGPAWMNGVNCTGSEDSLSKCPAEPMAEHSCDHSKDAGVECAEPPEIRLLGGTTECSGRVEILHDKLWGTICDDDWDLEDANVVCRYVGCGPAISAPRGSRFAPGHVRIWLDNVNCTGKENDISECPAKEWGKYDCNHNEDAGVVCIDIRLMNGTSHCSGRVEVYHNRQWGTICDGGWDVQDAEVVCRQLECGNALSASGGARSGQGSGPIWLNQVNCTGKEESLKDCQARSWEEHSCDHRRDASVECSGSEPYKVRLVNGSTQCSGRVEVLHDQEWGTVCEDGWNLNNAHVVCRELGCGKAISATKGSQFGQGSSPIWLDDVKCQGTEAALRDCRIRPWGQHNCRHGEDAGVVCSELRLVNGSNRCSGRVEIFHNQQWGTICSNRWGMKQAEVVCREMTCGVALKAPTAAFFGQGSGPIWKDDVNCAGNETLLRECPSKPWGQNNCHHGEDAGVVCADPVEIKLVNGSSRCSGRVEVFHSHLYGTVCDDRWDMNDAAVVCRNLDCGTPIYAPSRARFGEGMDPIWLDDVECTGTELSLADCKAKPWGANDCNHGEDASVVCSDDLRLVNGSNRCSGRVEIRPSHSEEWGTVCDRTWDINDAEVVCKQLVCGKAEPVLSGAHFGQGSGSIWLDDINCKGTEDAIAECSANTRGNNNCHHGQDAAVICSDKFITNVADVKLVDGPNSCAGRIEVFYQQQWGTVCDDRWDLTDASVVCKQLNCGIALEAPGRARYGPGTNRVWLRHVNCTGSEDSLKDCGVRPGGQQYCRHSEDASVVCSGPFEVRLANGPNSCAGQVELRYNGSWVSIGDSGWNLLEATVVCKQLGCGEAVSVPVGNTYGMAVGAALLDEVKCTGKESSLSECQAVPAGPKKCICGTYAGAVCKGKTGPVIIAVTLVLVAVALILGGGYLYLRKRRTGTSFWVFPFTRTQDGFRQGIAIGSRMVNGTPEIYSQVGAHTVQEMDSDTACLVKEDSASSPQHNN